MEVELKYGIPDTDVIEQMWNESVFKRYGSVDREGSVHMNAVYYDTEDGLLRKARAAYRIRSEGDKFVATFKWNGCQHEELFEREELNISLSGHTCRTPSLQVFAESGKAAKYIELVGDRPLVPCLETEFLRRMMRVDTGDTIFEAGLDTGLIKTSKGNLEICEIELELYSGDKAGMIRAAEDLARRFGLTTGVKSKFQRGIELLDGVESRD